MAWKFWFTWGIDKGENSIKPEMPNVSEIQPALVETQRRRLRLKLFESGKADLYTDGLTQVSVDQILTEAVNQGFQVWKRLQDGIGHAEYCITVKPTAYLNEYYKLVSAE